MYAFNSAAIFLPGHPYIESTTVLSDYQTLYKYLQDSCSGICLDVVNNSHLVLMRK